MFADARSVPRDTKLDTDVCIIGAGAAGITLALELIGSPFRVTVLESGGFQYETETQDLYQGDSIGLPYTDLNAPRLRFFGGTTNHWGGICRPFEDASCVFPKREAPDVPRCSNGLDRPAHDPGVLANAATPGEAVLLEELDGRAEEEAALCLATGGHLGDGLDETAAETGDLVERPLQARPGDASTAMPLVDEDAGDPPIRPWWSVLVVLALVLDARELFGATVLAPALGGAVLVDDKRGMSAPRAHAILLGVAIVDSLLCALGVIADAPAATVNPVVALDELGEGVPC